MNAENKVSLGYILNNVIDYGIKVGLFGYDDIVVQDWQDKETDMYEFSYTVNEDEVIVFDIQRVTLLVSPRNINSSMDEKNAALVDANAKINELSAQIESLSFIRKRQRRQNVKRQKPRYLM